VESGQFIRVTWEPALLPGQIYRGERPVHEAGREPNLLGIRQPRQMEDVSVIMQGGQHAVRQVHRIEFCSTQAGRSTEYVFAASRAKKPKLGWTELRAKVPGWTEATRMDRVSLLRYSLRPVRQQKPAGMG
jgi:hypothetical protein